jgi:hypothetical protein
MTSIVLVNDQELYSDPLDIQELNLNCIPLQNNDLLKNDQIIFIADNINELMIHDRRIILQTIYNSSLRSKLKEKGSGTQIKIDDLTNDIIVKLYNIINTKLQEQKLQLKI